MSDTHYEPGGGGINVSRIVRILGGDTEAVYLEGGEMGAFLGQLMDEEGIPRHAIRTGGQTRIAFMVREQSTGLEYRFVPEGPVVSAGELAELCAAAKASHAPYVIASGSLPRGLPETAFADLAHIARDAGSRFILDTSGAPLRAALATARPYLVKPSRDELEGLAGASLDDAAVKAMAARLVTEGKAEHVAVSLGADGAILAGPKGVIAMPAIHVRVRSAWARATASWAAMVWSLSEGQPIEDAFRFGLAAGAAAAMTPGTQLCRKEDILALYTRLPPAPAWE